MMRNVFYTFLVDVSQFTLASTDKRQWPPPQQPADEPIRRFRRAPEQSRLRRRDRNNGEDAVEARLVPGRAAVQV